MNAEQQIDLERRIQDLLAGELGQEDTTRLLTEVACDDESRDVLREMLELQQHCRRSSGLAAADTAMPASLRKVLATLRTE